MTAQQNLPFERFYNLANLSEAGDEILFTSSREDLARLAHLAGVDAVDNFEATVTLRRLSPNRFAYEATLTAAIVQSCVVTLDPVKSHVERRFQRVLQVSPGAARLPEPGNEIVLTLAGDEAPEEIQSTRYDLAAPLLEEFVLAIDPYPRAGGVTFEPPAAQGPAPESPFTVLKRLKIQD